MVETFKNDLKHGCTINPTVNKSCPHLWFNSSYLTLCINWHMARYQLCIIIIIMVRNYYYYYTVGFTCKASPRKATLITRKGTQKKVMLECVSINVMQSHSVSRGQEAVSWNMFRNHNKSIITFQDLMTVTINHGEVAVNNNFGASENFLLFFFLKFHILL